MTMTQNSSRRATRGWQPARTLLLAAGIAAGTACNSSDLNISNPNVATVIGASTDPTAFQLLATGLMSDQRATRSGKITTTGILGRESYNFTPQEGRNTTNFLLGIVVNGVQKLDPNGFAVAGWAGQFGVLRDIYNFENTVTASPTLTTAQKASS